MRIPKKITRFKFDHHQGLEATINYIQRRANPK